MKSVASKLKLFPVVKAVLKILDRGISHSVVEEAISDNNKYAIYRARELLNPDTITKDELDHTICVLLMHRKHYFGSEETPR